MKYRKKPIEVEAVQFTDENKNKVYNWAKSIQMNVTHGWDENNNPCLKIPTLCGELICRLGDYLVEHPFPIDWIKLYTLTPNIFEQLYEEVIE